MGKKRLDFWVASLLIVLAACVWIAFSLKPLWGGALITLLPVIYLCRREKKNYKKLFLGTLFLGIVLGFVFDFIEVLNGAWYVHNSVFPHLIFGIQPVDNVLGYGLMTLLILTFYEHFFDDEKDCRISKNKRKLFWIALGMAALVVVLMFADPHALLFSYPYLWGGIAAIVMPAIFIATHPKCINKFAKVTLFFLFVWFITEYAAVSTGGWTYGAPYHYIGWIQFLNISFPIEELLFWMLWYAAGIVAYYEYFLDDGK